MRLVVFALMSTILVSCNLFENKSDLSFEIESGSRTGRSNQTNFSDIQRKIIVPHCLKCHGEYMSYSTVYSQRSSILRSVETNRMPKKASALSSNLKKLLKDWIAAGAPETSQDDPNSRDTKIPSGLSENMQKLYKKHLEVQPILDDEIPLKFSTSGKTFEYDFGEGRVAQVQ